MKKYLLILAFLSLVVTNSFAIDASLGLKTGYTFNNNGVYSKDNFGNNWNNGAFLEVGAIKNLSFVFDADVSFASLYKLNPTTYIVKREISVDEVSAAALMKLRFGNAFRFVVAGGPTARVTFGHNDGLGIHTRNYDFIGATTLLGFELDCGPGYLFTFLSSSAYADLSMDYELQGIDFNAKATVGYAFKFKDGEYYSKKKPSPSKK